MVSRNTLYMREWRAKNRVRARTQSVESMRKWQSAHMGEKVARTRDWRDRNKEKTAAHNAVMRALRDGRLVRSETCDRCGEPSEHLHAHHENYSFWLDVAWLDPVCHAARHRELGW